MDEGSSQRRAGLHVDSPGVNVDDDDVDSPGEEAGHDDMMVSMWMMMVTGMMIPIGIIIVKTFMIIIIIMVYHDFPHYKGVLNETSFTTKLRVEGGNTMMLTRICIREGEDQEWVGHNSRMLPEGRRSRRPGISS